jgi:hypothetical protein
LRGYKFGEYLGKNMSSFEAEGRIPLAAGMVLNLEYAKGKGDNQGVYMKFGYGY